MSRRRTVAGAAGGGAGLVGLGSIGLLRFEARLARRKIPVLAGPPAADGDYGAAGRGAPLRLALIGDSSAAGIGVDSPRETPGALLAAALAEQTGRPVILQVAAVTGARSRDLAGQVDRTLLTPPHIAVVSIGANDVTHRVRRAHALTDQRREVRRLVEADVAVVLGTCPDLSAVRPIPHPLRALAGRWSRRMGRAQEQLAGDGVIVVPLGRWLGPRFTADPGLFCPDGFHPSAAGYRVIVETVLPAVLAVAGPAPGSLPAHVEGASS
ncbi:MAG TPA: SGNH/GDSL hydrolase family protein [Mycobacteriales bacterium]|nr:SGNH/GDSL hydrolase family protein [Mycobacteriales bacterium]